MVRIRSSQPVATAACFRLQIPSVLLQADLPQHVVAQKQRHLAGLKAAVEESLKVELVKKYEAKYKKVRSPLLGPLACLGLLLLRSQCRVAL